ncbi:acyl-CoA dehydrogenase family protein [Micromonospora sp. NPDC048871]|uniref:acyl-CoA dehydrogenase family protein n=1 Tax=Micromonospora sp. NPDC048871 TaxID=3364259 RepID=UPI00372493EF
MDFHLSTDQDLFVKEIRAFASERVAPFRVQSDRAGRYREGLLTEIAATGLFGLRIPTGYGGRGLDTAYVGLALEELAAADLSVCFPVLNAALVGGVLAANATEEQLARWLPPIARGESVVALALTEPEHGTDAANIGMRARPEGEGWVVSGEKTSIMAAVYATHALLFVRTGGAGPRGISAFYLSLDTPGVRVEGQSDLGCRSGGRGRILLEEVRLSPADLVGAEGMGFVQVMRGFGVSRAYIALMSIAVGRAALDAAFAHAGGREAFGQPLSRFQAVTFPLVEHLTMMHAARLVAFEALTAADTGGDPRLPANMAKWWAPKAAMEAVHQSLLTLGHLGWSEDGPMAQRLRDVVGLQLADGTAAATKLVVARHLLGRERAP